VTHPHRLVAGKKGAVTFPPGSVLAVVEERHVEWQRPGFPVIGSAPQEIEG
jgi:hypothetical protein